jgi:hypothetical protein
MSVVDRSHARMVAGPWQEYETGSSGRVCRRDVDCREMEGDGDPVARVVGVGEGSAMVGSSVVRWWGAAWCWGRRWWSTPCLCRLD